MKVTFLVPEDPSDATPNLRALRERNALHDAGHDVKLVWVELIRTTPPLGRFLERVAYQRAYTKALAESATMDDPDLIVAHDIYTLPAGRIAARKLNVPLVYDCHENWPSLIAENSRLEALVAKWIEQRSKIDHVLAYGPTLAERFRGMGIPSTVLYNARAERDVKRIPKEAARAMLGFDRNDFILGYIGSQKRLEETGLDTLLKRVTDDLGIRLLIIGGRPFSEIPVYYGAIDAGFIALDERPNHLFALPNKLFDYMAFGVPVIAPDYPEIAPIVRDNHAGMLLVGWQYPKTREEFLRDVLGVAMERLSDLEKMGDNGRKAFLERYAWEKQAPKFVAVAEDLCRAGKL